MTAPFLSLHRPPGTPGTGPTGWSTRNPQWWIAPLAVAGWVWLLGVPLLQAYAGQHSVAHHGHGAHAPTGSGVSVPSQIAHWTAMIAVMLPLAWDNVRYAARRVPTAACARVTAMIVAGWGTAWAITAVVLTMITGLTGALLGPRPGAWVAIGLALAWQLTRGRFRALARCHQRYAPPLPEPERTRGCGAYGLRLGRDCAVACGPMMLVMAATGHHVVAAVAMVALGWFERRRPHHDPSRFVPPLALLATAGLSLALT